MLQQRPDFTIIGGQFDGKVWLLASKTLTHFELEHTTDYDDVYSWWGEREPIRSIPRARRIEFHCGVRDYVQVIADTYGEAWAMLFDEWTPEPVRRRELENPKAIEG